MRNAAGAKKNGKRFDKFVKRVIMGNHTKDLHSIMKLLIGNSFPLTLIRRSVNISPRPLSDLMEALGNADGVDSFWGHENTLSAVNGLLGIDLTPRESRPALSLDPSGLPGLYGKSYSECWIVSPDYIPGFRPAIGAEVGSDKITGWQILKMEWVSEPTEVAE